MIFGFTAQASEAVLVSSGNSQNLLNVTSFSDVEKGDNRLTAELLVALGIMSPPREGMFLPDQPVSNAIALKIIFGSCGKEELATRLSHDVGARAKAGLGEYDSLSWADGYFILALEEGLISRNEFIQAYSVYPSDIHRSASVSAQNFVKWMALAHGIEPTTEKLPGDTYIDPEYISFYSALYHKKIFSLEDINYFAPWRFISKEDICIVLEKFESLILPHFEITTEQGTIDSISTTFSQEGYERTIKYSSSSDSGSIFTFGNKSEAKRS